MSNVAYLPIEADRYGACVRQIYIRGLDLTGVAMRAQIRLAGDTPGAPLVDLLNVTNGNAEGLRLVGVTTEEGVPVSHIELVINETTLEGLPYAGELGSATELLWDWQLVLAGRKQRIAKGEFVITGDGVTGADNAPTNRPQAWSRSFSPTAGMRTGAALTFGDETIDVTIDGANLVAAEVGRAVQAQDKAEAAQQKADLSAGAAQGAARYFTSIAAGEAASVPNQAFATDDGAGNVIYYRRTPGGSVEIGRAVTPAALSATNGSKRVGFSQPNGSSRTVEDKARETVSVLDFGAVGDGITDDTHAFNAAIATGKKVFVPLTNSAGDRAIYSVSRIAVVSNIHISGEKNGMSLAPLLHVRTNNTAAFYNSENDNVFHCTFENLACAAAAGVTGASFYAQSTQTFYSGYFTFRNIETHLTLKISYSGLFIFALWDRVRDGYIGVSNDTQHIFLVALAGSYGQTNAQNINRIKDSMIFSNFGGPGAIVASWGVLWSIENTDFEKLLVRAIAAQNLFQVKFTSCWFEDISADSIIDCGLYPGRNDAPSTAFFEHCNFVFTGTAPHFATMTGDSTVAFRRCLFNLIPTGMKLADKPRQVDIDASNRLTGGPGVSGFTIGVSGPFEIPVGTTFVDVAKLNGTGGLFNVSGYNPNGGTPGAWTRRVMGGSSVSIVGTDSDPGGLGAVFQVSGGFLQMKVASGSALVTVG